MNLSLMVVLKQKMETAKQLSDVWNYFLDHFGLDPAFVKLGRETQGDPFLVAVLHAVGEQLFQRRPVTIAGEMWKELPEYQFIHGACHMEGKMANLIYFEDLKTGILAIPWSLTPPETKFSRFRGQLFSPRTPPKPSVN